MLLRLKSSFFWPNAGMNVKPRFDYQILIKIKKLREGVKNKLFTDMSVKRGWGGATPVHNFISSKVGLCSVLMVNGRRINGNVK